MWKLKGCPRCGGDLLIEKDYVYGWHEKCIQCSFSRDLLELVEFKEQPDLPREKPVTS